MPVPTGDGSGVSAGSRRHVLLMAHGAAESIADLPDYYTHVRGRPPPPALLDELTQRYRAIGGRSPLRFITESLAARLQTELDRRHGTGVSRVTFGFRHTRPFLEDVIAATLAEGATDLLGVVLAPHRSRFVEEGYGGRVHAALASASRAPRFQLVPQWHLEPSFVALEAELVRQAIARLPDASGSVSRVCFTAHSLPQSMLAEGDPYPDQLREGAQAIAEKAGIPADQVVFAWQSAGRTDDQWLGPDIREALRDEYARGTRSLVVCPHGFVSDHLEILYDIDIEARGVAESLGIRLERTEMPNDDPRFARVLADVVDRWGGRTGR